VVAGNNRNAELGEMAAYVLRRVTESVPPTTYPPPPRPGGWVADRPALVFNEGPAYAGGAPVCH
jgi:hypothetical protein